jgi:hypothetical protein
MAVPYDLEQKLSKVKPDTFVIIEYLGPKPLPNGKSLNTFRTFVDSDRIPF